MSRLKKLLLACVVIAAIAALAGYRYYSQLVHEQLIVDAAGALAGRVDYAHADRVMVALVSGSQGDSTIHGTTRTGVSGLFAFVLPESDADLSLVAFDDVNGNRQLDRGEPGFIHTWAQREITAGSLAHAGLQNIVLEAITDQQAYRLIAGSSMKNLSGVGVPVAFGDIAAIDSPVLAHDTGKDGLWRSRSALHTRGMGVYFLQSYDPDRTPVVFVHGAAGAPSEFKSIIGALDQTRFQPWVFAYPSGLSLAGVSDAMSRLLLGLKRQFGFRELIVVAHSMGGIVSLPAIARINEAAPGSVTRFVSLATPFGGHRAAGKGVAHSPVVVPSWRDIMPGSAWLEALHNEEHAARHLIVYATRTRDSRYIESPNDGVVSVASQLQPAVRARAESSLGFDVSHTGILTDSDVQAALFGFIR